MSQRTIRSWVIAPLLAIAPAVGSAAAQPATTRAAAAPAPDPGGDRLAERTIRSLEANTRRNPDDFIAYMRLADLYLGRLRRTGDVQYLKLAEGAGRLSLSILPAEQNPGALVMVGRALIASHAFAAARETGQRLVQLAPAKAYGYEVLGDALFELGEYDRAAEAYQKLDDLSDGGVSAQARLGKLAQIRGDTAAARQHFDAALAGAKEAFPPNPEALGWCHWQLGELDFSLGDYPAAERCYRDALDAYPGDRRFLVSLGRVLAARGDLAGAIQQYGHAARIVPEVATVGTLGDLYHLAGRDKDAAAQYAVVEQIARLSAAQGGLYDRSIALFYADHDRKPQEAYTLAAREYAARKDVWGADALAWAALKAGKVPEARDAIAQALRLGTKDARLFYHAGMIARAAGEKDQARDLLRRALDLSPGFDPLQARRAREE
jgi:tetratricopeptide (TPR) repeat protein